MSDSSSKEEYVVECDLGVEWDPVTPCPHLVQSEENAFLAFWLRDPDIFGPSTRPRAEPEFGTVPVPRVGVLEWQGCAGAVLGGPNDEAINGHRLWNKGLSACLWAGEVHNSSWIAAMDRVNSVHLRHDPDRFSGLHHYVLRFKESTFECVAVAFRLKLVATPIEETLLGIVQQLAQ